jgi:hypothetical protein
MEPTARTRPQRRHVYWNGRTRFENSTSRGSERNRSERTLRRRFAAIQGELFLIAPPLDSTVGSRQIGTQELAKAANVDAQVFIRTTETRHRSAVEHVWVSLHLSISLPFFLGLNLIRSRVLQNELEKRGYIYKSSYAGWYAVSDEAYYAETQVAETIDPKSGEKYMVSLSGSLSLDLGSSSPSLRLGDRLRSKLGPKSNGWKKRITSSNCLRSENLSSSGSLRHLTVRILWSPFDSKRADESISLFLKQLFNLLLERQHSSLRSLTHPRRISPTFQSLARHLD